MQESAPSLQHGPLDPRLARALADAQRAILARPRLSIRLRFVVGLALCFLLCCAFAIAMVRALAEVRDATVLVQRLEKLALHVDGARTVERAEVRSPEVVAHAGDHLAAAAATLAEIRGRTSRSEELAALAARIEAYRAAVAAGISSPEDERALHAAGDDVAALLAAISERETAAADRRLREWERTPAVLLGVLLVLFAVIAAAFGRALVRPIRKLQGFTTSIAAGDFTLIQPTRRYRDEFSELVLAVNTMLAELQAHQERCVKAGKLAAVGTITSGIAHELNNPLNNISLTTEALMEEWSDLGDDEKWRLLQDVSFETERASEIVKSLLDFTRNQRPELVPVDVTEVIQRTFRLVQNEASLAGVTLETDFPPGLPRALGAFDQLRQVFLNLFLNAIQAMPGGGVLTVAAMTEDAGRVCVEVSDTGDGIPADVLPHIFDPFFTTKAPGKGTGLGLSMTSSIIKKHGGEIHVTSVLGKGATFHLCLPVAPATALAPADPAAARA